jgi:hypothetical protein
MGVDRRDGRVPPRWAWTADMGVDRRDGRGPPIWAWTAEMGVDRRDGRGPPRWALRRDCKSPIATAWDQTELRNLRQTEINRYSRLQLAPTAM